MLRYQCMLESKSNSKPFQQIYRSNVFWDLTNHTQTFVPGAMSIGFLVCSQDISLASSFTAGTVMIVNVDKYSPLTF